MKRNKLTRMGQQLKQFAAQFLQSGSNVLGSIIPLAELEQWVREEAPKHRSSQYMPLRTLLLFIEQVLGSDHSCQDAVARGASHKLAHKTGTMPGTVNAAWFRDMTPSTRAKLWIVATTAITPLPK